MVLLVLEAILSIEFGIFAPIVKSLINWTALEYKGYLMVIWTSSTCYNVGGDCIPLKVNVICEDVYADDNDRFENTINVAEVCRLITQMGVHELVDANIAFDVVLMSKERSHHFLKFIYIYIPDVALKSVDLIINVRLEIVDTLGGANDHPISE